MKKIVYLLLTMILISTSLAFYSCSKDDEDQVKESGFTSAQEFKDNKYIKAALNDAGIVTYDGVEPPNIEGEYLTNECYTYDASSNLSASIGTYMDSYFRFFNQTSNGKIQCSEESYSGGTSQGFGSFITGYSNKFSIFIEALNSNGSSVVAIISGEKHENGDLGIKGITVYVANPPQGLEQGDWWAYLPKMVNTGSSSTLIVTTSPITNITSNSATCGGNVTDDGGSSVTGRGVCWSTSQNPTISNNHTTDGSGTGQFTSSITGLTKGVTYYVRAYATNSNGTAYGNQVSFTPIQGQSMEYLIVSAYDGVYKVDKYGNSSYFLPGCYDIEIFDNYIYALSGNYVKKYSINGNLIASIPISSQVDYKIAFVIIPNQGFAFLDNQYDKVYFTDFNGNYITEVSIPNGASGELQNINGIVVNNKLIISENGNNGIISIDLNNYNASIFKDFSNLQGWLGAIEYANSNYYLCQSQKIHSFTENSNPSLIATVPTGNFTGIVVDGATGYASVNFENRVIKLDLNTGTYSNFITEINKPDDIEIYWSSN